MKFSQFWNNFVEQTKFALIRHIDTDSKAPEGTSVLSLVWVRGFSDGFITCNGYNTSKGSHSSSIPTDGIQEILPLPISSLFKANPPESQMKAGGGRGRISGNQGESVGEYFNRFVVPFVSAQGLEELWSANKGEIITGQN